MKNQPVLYDSLKSILHHMDANLRIKISLRMPSIRATERAVPLKMRYLSFSDATVGINDVHYQLGVCRDYPNGDIPQYVKRENARGGVSYDFDRFGFEIPFGSSPILPGDVLVRNGDESIVQTDTDEFEELYRNKLTRCEILLGEIAEEEPVVKPRMEDSWRAAENPKKNLQEMADHARDKLKPFHCRRHNLPPPFNCYIQLSTVKCLEAKPLQILAYNRKLYEAVKQFNHILFAYRPVIQVSQLFCLGNHFYRIPIDMKISANELVVSQSRIASIVKMLKGDVNTLRVFAWKKAENWWQHRLVHNANELITQEFSEPENACLMLKMFGNKMIRFHNHIILATEEYCELIESWMSVKREVGSELWIGFRLESYRNDVLEVIRTRMEVVRKDERSVRVRGTNGKQIEVCEELCDENWWQHRLVQNANELITEDYYEPENACLMLKMFGNKMIRFHDHIILTTEEYCELIESWMSVKREVESKLWIGLYFKKHRNSVREVIWTRMEVVRRDERSVRVRGTNGTVVEVCEAVCEDESMEDYWTVEIIEN